MSDQAAVCPHCGAAHPERAIREARSEPAPETARTAQAKLPKLTPEETAALLNVAGVGRGSRPRGFWSHFLLPAPGLSGGLFLLDAGLIVLTLPLIAGVAASLAFGRSRNGKALVSGFAGENFLIGALGGIVTLLIGFSYEALGTVIPVVVVAWAALAGRSALRARGGHADPF